MVSIKKTEEGLYVIEEEHNDDVQGFVLSRTPEMDHANLQKFLNNRVANFTSQKIQHQNAVINIDQSLAEVNALILESQKNGD